ncbi:hypothetical protein OOT46_28355 [Aquabacterium sp. A7-Y]|uniref:hypothetical protein n=1 Tax=Aquabacterium sp. A7-Y TaxID=1349605 RepID=UPI00223DB2DD|nr:hypothetical protein [Aquabacterium sp. A7-Y]MCW7541714.1 hypothetical protein [Aquabacterium sp. A7-Y]
MAQTRNTPSQHGGTDSQGSRGGSLTGSASPHTGLGDQRAPEPAAPGADADERGSQHSSQGLAGAQGSGGGAERGMQQDRDRGARGGKSH